MIRIRISFILVCITCSTFSTKAQQQPEEENNIKTNDNINIYHGVKNKGRLYFYWGWNRAWYSKSDILFQGKDYDFTLEDVEAKDRPTAFSLDPYFKLSRITIPQTMLKFGYFITENISLELGYDHMKYVMIQNQFVKINGRIHNPELDFDKATFNDEEIQLTKPFLEFEHTDGLNYVNVEVCYHQNILKLLNVSSEKIEVKTHQGIGFGGLYPKSNVTLLSKEKHDDFHWSGYGLGAKVGVNLTFFKHIFLQSEFKSGYINMPKIRTTNSTEDKASQHFFFHQLNYVFGYTFWI